MVLWCKIFSILFSYEDKDIDRFSNLHQCTFELLTNCSIYHERGFLISELGKIIRLILLSQATDPVKAPFQL